MKSIRPKNHLSDAAKLYPAAWKQIEEFRAARGHDLPDWPDWCFLPLAGFYSIVSADAGVDQLPLHQISDVAKLAAIGTWRATQGIYRFDPAVYESVSETPINGDLPCDVFYKLPEWCIYIETPNTSGPWGRQYGAWVHLERDMNDGRDELRLLLDCEDDLMPIMLHLGKWSIEEAIKRFAKEAGKQLGGQWLMLNDEQIEQLKSVVTPTLSLTIYLCAENADFGDQRPQRPRPKKTKKGWRLFPPDKPKQWDVAVRLGGAMRKYRQAEETAQLGERSGPRPHVRRAHWHSFWKGPRDGERKIIVKWMPPIPVNVDSEELPSVIKRKS